MKAGGDKAKTIATCGDTAGGHWYRAIIQQSTDERWIGGLIEPDAVPANFQRDPPPGGADLLVETYSAKEICRRPPETANGSSSLYLRFDAPLTRGGRAAPYPASVPECVPGESIERIAIKPEDASGPSQPMSQSPESFIPAACRDPRDEEVDSLRAPAGEVGAIGFCQKKVPAAPDRFGLFLVFTGGKVAALKDIPLSNDARQSADASRALRDALPESFRTCAPSDEYIAAYTAQARAVVDEQRNALALTRDPFITAVAAPRAAEAVELSLPFLLDEGQFDFLSGIAAFGLSYGLSPEELVKTADDIADPANADDVLYRLFLLTTIGVAGNLHAENAGNSALSRNFDPFARDVSAAIAGGRIGIRIQTASDIMGRSKVWATYDSRRNEIISPPLDGEIPPETLIEPMIHELTHAFQDMRRRAPTAVEADEKAYLQGVAAAALMKRRAPMVETDDTVALRNSLSEMHEEEKDRQSLCMGFTEEILRRSKEREKDMGDLLATWGEGVVALAATGEAGGDLSRPFHEYYQFVAYGERLDRAASRWELYVGERADHDSLEDPLGQARRARTRMEADYSAILRAPDKSVKRARAAAACVDHLSEASALAYHADRGLWRELSLLSLDRADLVGDALLYLPRAYDGI